jgi:hypothetical protein
LFRLPPFSISSNPNGELAKELKAIADIEPVPGMKFKVIES